MKTTDQNPGWFLLFLLLMAGLPDSTQGQSSQPRVSDSTAKGEENKMTEADFIKTYIRDNILEIKMAQVAVEKSGTPRIKTMAREIIADDRDMLQNLLSVAKSSNIRGTSEQEVDSALKQLLAAPGLTKEDSAANITSGNTATDSLGSGSSGSGNVSGEDTGTLSRSLSKKRNADYSANGETYIFTNRANFFQSDKDDSNKRFDERWISVMLGSQAEKLRDFEAMASAAKSTELRAVILKAIPRFRLNHNTLARLNKGSKGSTATGDGQQGPSDKNTNR